VRCDRFGIKGGDGRWWVGDHPAPRGWSVSSGLALIGQERFNAAQALLDVPDFRDQSVDRAAEVIRRILTVYGSGPLRAADQLAGTFRGLVQDLLRPFTCIAEDELHLIHRWSTELGTSRVAVAGSFLRRVRGPVAAVRPRLGPSAASLVFQRDEQPLRRGLVPARESDEQGTDGAEDAAGILA
jgi:hypothetical protein